MFLQPTYPLPVPLALAATSPFVLCALIARSRVRESSVVERSEGAGVGPWGRGEESFFFFFFSEDK